MAGSLAAVLLAFSATGGLRLWSVDSSGALSLGSSETADSPARSIVFDAGDGVAIIAGAGPLSCGKVAGCTPGDATIALPAGLSGGGLVVLGGQDLGFSDVSGLGTEILDAVRASAGGAGFDLVPGLDTGMACGVVDEAPQDDLVGDLPNDELVGGPHAIKSPRDIASGLATGLRVSDEGGGAGALPFVYGVHLQPIGSSAGADSADTWAVCAAWSDGRLASYAVVALRNGDSLADRPSRVTGVVTHGFMD
ncbi:MAG: hypothetical protein Q8P18_32630 [Pseudomonadota bacterium]|nr:hypothetical protein [Pseudomonadota bacterium]